MQVVVTPKEYEFAGIKLAFLHFSDIMLVSYTSPLGTGGRPSTSNRMRKGDCILKESYDIQHTSIN